MSEKFTAFTLDRLLKGDYPTDRPVHIYTEGIFDLFHYGHSNQLKQAKEAFPWVKLTVGVCPDDEVLFYKGGPLVMNFQERCLSVEHCSYVDVVLKDHPYWPTIEFLDSIQADLIAHDDMPYAAPNTEDCFSEFKQAGRFLATERTVDVSTTNLIQRIIDRHDEFKLRNNKRLTNG